jgi:ADP-ribose pyrophosphatase YjhB (NUDIX family)
VGVGAIVLDSEDRVLLVRRRREPLRGEWSLPGGALELGESLEDGVRREVQEETGLEVSPIELVTVFEHIAEACGPAQGVRFHYVVVDYRCVVTGGRLQPATDAAEARWAGWDELGPQSAYGLQAAALGAIRRALGQVHPRPDARSQREGLLPVPPEEAPGGVR